MKPSGSASRKKSRSACVSAGPEQPKTTARGSRLDKDPPHAPPLQLVALALGRRRIGDRSGLKAVVDAAGTEIGARGDEAERAEEVALLALQALPFLGGRVRCAYGPELETVALAAGGGRWRRRGSARRLALGRRRGRRRRGRRRGGGARRRWRRGGRDRGAGLLGLLRRRRGGLWRRRRLRGGRRLGRRRARQRRLRRRQQLLDAG